MPVSPLPASETEGSSSGLERLGRRLLVPLGLGVLVVVGLALSANPAALARSLRGFDIRLLIPVLSLSLVNYILRFVRWEVYLRRLEVRLPRGRSLAVFLAGFLLSVTPGKAGELGKAWLVRELGGGPALRVVPAVLAERVVDLLGVLLLIALGSLPFPGGPWIAAAGFAGVAVAVAALTWRRLADLLFRLLGRLPVAGPRVPHLVEVYDRLRSLLSPGLLLFALALSVVAWGAEGVGFFLVVRQYAPKAGLLLSIFNYTGSTFLGALSMLPGGLGAAEGALAALLHSQGLDTADAGSVTLVTRAATLWFAVALGVLAVPFLARWLGRKSQASENS
ncbi:MAG TPA: lysylphosphatidylglycerol synthase transmembrane domain-containing protein [Thermoanaerobaculia bacterium]|nr:lysylphosphatidylglycerol synthase transmembrane domain-containing protein [Thermoanaerobaculia bacterium]